MSRGKYEVKKSETLFPDSLEIKNFDYSKILFSPKAPFFFKSQPIVIKHDDEFRNKVLNALKKDESVTKPLDLEAYGIPYKENKGVKLIREEGPIAPTDSPCTP